MPNIFDKIMASFMECCCKIYRPIHKCCNYMKQKLSCKKKYRNSYLHDNLHDNLYGTRNDDNDDNDDNDMDDDDDDDDDNNYLDTNYDYYRNNNIINTHSYQLTDEDMMDML